MYKQVIGEKRAKEIVKQMIQTAQENNITFINYQEINILEVLNKVDGMLIEATTPYFG